MASVRCVDDALGFTSTNGHPSVGTGSLQIPVVGNTIRNIIEGADLVMSHILHFYHLCAIDYINATGTVIDGVPPWSPQDVASDMVTTPLAQTLVLNYVGALESRRECHRLLAMGAGKTPCQPAFIPGGVTKVVDSGMKTNMQTLLTTIRNFIDQTYVPNVVTVAKAFSGTLLTGDASDGVGQGCGKYIAYGTFPDANNNLLLQAGYLDATNSNIANWTSYTFSADNIREYVHYSYYDAGLLGQYEGKHPSVGATKPSYGKSGAYSFLKAPRYIEAGQTNVCEVGPLARVLVNYVAGVTPWVSTVNTFMTSTMAPLTTTHIPALRSVIGRHGARALEAQAVANAMTGWINSLSTGTGINRTYRHRNIPRTTATGYGLTEAPRGALGHWIRLDGRKISNYQCVVPSTWNLGPRDPNANMGPVEQAVNGSIVADTDEGRLRVGRIVRSFDPCIACAVHIVSPDKKKVTKFNVVDPTR
jgi:hydrogenase large subunit